MSRHLSKQRAHSLPLIIVFFLVGVAMASPAHSQDTLPSFRAVIRSGKVVLSWVNLSSRVIQLTIQRSSDSLQGFKSIAPMPDPSLTENGFMDMRAPDTRQYYRIYVQESGGYFFTTPSRRAIPESEAPPIVRARPIYIPPAPKYTPIIEVQEPAQQIPTINSLTASGMRPIIAKRAPGRIRFAVQPIAVEIKELESEDSQLIAQPLSIHVGQSRRQPSTGPAIGSRSELSYTILSTRRGAVFSGFQGEGSFPDHRQSKLPEIRVVRIRSI